tara:strand:+ start:127 stop:819 length:693 start_codon:yes stop_codon:yes gene_type:complete
MYTTASVLNVRSEPSLSSKTVAKLPYGTALEVSTQRVSPDGIEWLALKDNSGFISTQYLSAEEPKMEGAPHFFIRSTSFTVTCASTYIEQNRILALKENEVSAYFEVEELWHKKASIKGSYAFKQGVLRISLPQTQWFRKEDPDSDWRPDKSRDAQEFNLTWDEPTKAYYTDWMLKHLKTPAYIWSERDCLYIPKNIGPKFRTFCDSVKNEGITFEVIGPFCRRSKSPVF